MTEAEFSLELEKAIHGKLESNTSRAELEAAIQETVERLLKHPGLIPPTVKVSRQTETFWGPVWEDTGEHASPDEVRATMTLMLPVDRIQIDLTVDDNDGVVVEHLSRKE